jgi:hypothetical protein
MAMHLLCKRVELSKVRETLAALMPQTGTASAAEGHLLCMGRTHTGGKPDPDAR